MADLGVKANYVVDADGKRLGVLLSVGDYDRLINRLTELEAYQEANDIEIVDDLLQNSTQTPFDVLPTYRQRRGPGGMIVI